MLRVGHPHVHYLPPSLNIPPNPSELSENRTPAVIDRVACLGFPGTAETKRDIVAVRMSLYANNFRSSGRHDPILLALDVDTGSLNFEIRPLDDFSSAVSCRELQAQS